MFRRCAGVLRNARTGFIHQRDVSRHAIGPIPGHLDLRRAVRVGQAGVTRRPEADAERARRTSAHRIHQIVQSRAARRNERLLAEMKYRIETVGTETGMRAGPAVVEYMGLLALIDIEFVRHASWILVVGKSTAMMAVVAKRFGLRFSATA